MSDRVSPQLVAKNISASTLIKPGPGRCIMVSTITATSVAIHDAAATGDAAAGNQIAQITPTATTFGVFLVDMPFFLGLVVVPTGGAVAVGYV